MQPDCRTHEMAGTIKTKEKYQCQNVMKLNSRKRSYLCMWKVAGAPKNELGLHENTIYK